MMIQNKMQAEQVLNFLPFNQQFLYLLADCHNIDQHAFS